MEATAREKPGAVNVRLFVAFPLPERLWKNAETVHINNAAVKNLRWTPLQNLHITIFFLGAVSDTGFDKIKDKIRSEVFDAPPFSLELEKISLQKGRRHSGMIWMKFLRNDNFFLLANRLQHALGEFLLHPPVLHDPIPHITLARWKGTMEIEKINLQFDPGFSLPPIDFCELWQSVSTDDGVKYKSLERFEMK